MNGLASSYVGASTRKSALRPTTGSIETNPSTVSSVSRAKRCTAPAKGHIIAAEDGTPLLLRHWPPSRKARAQLLMVHDYLDYGERFEALAQALAPQSICCHAVDLRGHGISSGHRGYVRTLADYSDDIQASLNALPPGPQFVLGVGHGALCVLDFVAQRRPRLLGVIAIAPPVAETPKVPQWRARGMRWIGQLFPRARVPQALWPAVGFAKAPPVGPVAQSMMFAPKLAKHMTLSWWRDVPRIQDRVRRLHKLPAPLLFVEDVERHRTDADRGALVCTEDLTQQTRHVRVAEAKLLLRAGEIDAELIDTIAEFIQQQLPKRPRVSRRTTTAETISSQSSWSAVPSYRSWFDGFAEWPGPTQQREATAMPGSWPQ